MSDDFLQCHAHEPQYFRRWKKVSQGLGVAFIGFRGVKTVYAFFQDFGRVSLTFLVEIVSRRR